MVMVLWEAVEADVGFKMCCMNILAGVPAVSVRREYTLRAKLLAPVAALMRTSHAFVLEASLLSNAVFVVDGVPAVPDVDVIVKVSDAVSGVVKYVFSPPALVPT
jgi:hypothetical protein